MPVSFGARNLDVYAADLERIEVLSASGHALWSELAVGQHAPHYEQA